jgi:hypothetical protein
MALGTCTWQLNIHISCALEITFLDQFVDEVSFVHTQVHKEVPRSSNDPSFGSITPRRKQGVSIERLSWRRFLYSCPKHWETSHCSLGRYYLISTLHVISSYRLFICDYILKGILFRPCYYLCVYIHITMSAAPNIDILHMGVCLFCMHAGRLLK